MVWGGGEAVLQLGGRRPGMTARATPESALTGGLHLWLQRAQRAPERDSRLRSGEGKQRILAVYRILAAIKLTRGHLRSRDTFSKCQFSLMDSSENAFLLLHSLHSREENRQTNNTKQKKTKPKQPFGSLLMF